MRAGIMNLGLVSWKKRQRRNKIFRAILTMRSNEKMIRLSFSVFKV